MAANGTCHLPSSDLEIGSPVGTANWKPDQTWKAKRSEAWLEELRLSTRSRSKRTWIPGLVPTLATITAPEVDLLSFEVAAFYQARLVKDTSGIQGFGK